MRILMVDDQAADREESSRLLRAAFHDLDLTETGSREVYQQALQRGPFDVVLTEHALGWTDARQVLHDVRARAPGTPVIMITGAGSERLAVQGFRDGLSDYVRKEHAPEELVPAIARAIERRPDRTSPPTDHEEDARARLQDELECVRAELHAERELLQAIFDQAPVMFTIYDPAVRTITLSKHVERVTGWTAADRVRTPILELCYPDPDYRAAVIDYRNSLLPGYRDFDMLTKRGDVIQASWANLQLPDGRRMGIGLEITERKQVERELQRSVAEFTALFNQMTEGLVLFDPDGNLLDMNPAALAIHGFDTVHSLQRHLHTLDDTFKLYELESGRLLSTSEWPIGRVLRGETFTRHEVRVCRPELGRSWIGSYGGAPVYGPDGELFLAIVTLRDVTAEREAEQALSESEARTRTVLESIGDGFLALDLDWRSTYFNATGAGILGMKREDLIGGIIWDLFPHARYTKFWEEYHRAIESNQPVHFEEFYPAPLNLWLECHGYPSSEGLSVYFRDVTERKRAEQALNQYLIELEAVNDANRMLLREVNHRVKNNLTAILGLIYSEQRRLGAERRCEDETSRCQLALGDLGERVRSLATAHTLLSASGWRPLRANELVEAVVEASAPTAADVEALVLEVTDHPLCVTAEQAHCLALVIGELTTNTVKYGRGADRLHIAVEIGLENGEATLIYRNSGPGYPDHVLNGEGHSVGLGLVRSLITHSLRGSWSIRNDGGPVTEIRFPTSYEPPSPMASRVPGPQ
jgi:PAS domain S-box-containing protein